MDSYSKTIMLYGHIIDSLSLAKVFDEILDRGGDYVSERIDIGKTKKDMSHATLKVIAPDLKLLDSILNRLHQLGAVVLEEDEITLKPAERDGVFPEGFYATSNFDTSIRYRNEWIPVGNTCMDSGIRFDADRLSAECVKMIDVKEGEKYVVGIKGIRIKYAEKTDRNKNFSFMESGVSSEKPKRILIRKAASLMEKIRKNEREKVLFVCGPAIVHTGARDHLCRLIDEGYVNLLFAGNALAVHDIEASLYGTSLGVSLVDGLNTFEGHRNHLYAINTIRSIGGISQAVDYGALTEGIMYSCIKNNCDFVLAGSIRDDGPLPEVITDTLKAQKAMKQKLADVKLVVMLSTMLHSIAVGNMLPASIKTVCVDIVPSVVTKLSDRGTHQATGIVMDVEAFLHELCEYL
ncbi:MAG: TIGR00300 family protein [Proteobacteria bacterium]|nr:TIGR00300 family protein [Pseudomonadota bacterium]